MLGFIGEKLNNKTKLILKNNKTSRVWNSTTVSSFVRGATDLAEANKYRGWYNRYSDEDLTDLLHSKFVYPEGTTFQRSEGTSVEVHCPLCHEDVYTKNEATSGKFKSTVQNLISGRRPCRCTSVYRYSGKDKKLQASTGVNKQGGVFKFMDITTESVHWTCIKGHSVKTPLSSIRVGKGCSRCKKYGFNPERPANFYIVRWYGYGESYIKYGVTNRSVLVRVKEQMKLSHLDYETLHTYYFKSGQCALDLENKVKEYFGRVGVCSRNWLPDGYTETITDSQENIEYLRKLCEKV